MSSYGDAPLKVKDHGIEKVLITMNFAGVREADDSDLAVIDAYNKSYGSSTDMKKLLTSVLRNETHTGERQSLFDPSSGALSNLKFEIEVKDMMGHNAHSKVKKYTFKASDFDWETDPYLPVLDITNEIQVLGDYYSTHKDDKRSITTFRMYADYETLVA